MMRLSAFTDEIHQPIEKALDYIETNMAPMRFVELRNVAVGSAPPMNIARFSGEPLKSLKAVLEERDFGVSSVSSGFCKYKRTSWDDEKEWKEQQEILRQSLEVAS
jgi:hypothetical protein